MTSLPRQMDRVLRSITNEAGVSPRETQRLYLFSKALTHLRRHQTGGRNSLHWLQKKKRCGQESDQTVPSLQTLFPRNPQFLNLPKRIPLVSQVRPQPVFRRPSYTSPQLPSTSIQQSMAQLSTIGMCPPLLPISLSTLDIA